MQLDDLEKESITTANRIGIVKGQHLYDDGYDFDEMNPEIAKMFGMIKGERDIENISNFDDMRR